MRVRKPKKRRAWLITWESATEQYLKDLNRPRVVAILSSRLNERLISRILGVLSVSERALTYTEKVSYTLYKPPVDWVRRDFNGTVTCGGNPWLQARLVKDLWIETHETESIYHQTLHWTEYERYAPDPDSSTPKVVAPERTCSEDTHFDVEWYGKSLAEEERQQSAK